MKTTPLELYEKIQVRDLFDMCIFSPQWIESLLEALDRARELPDYEVTVGAELVQLLNVIDLEQDDDHIRTAAVDVFSSVPHAEIKIILNNTLQAWNYEQAKKKKG